MTYIVAAQTLSRISFCASSDARMWDHGKYKGIFCIVSARKLSTRRETKQNTNNIGGLPDSFPMFMKTRAIRFCKLPAQMSDTGNNEVYFTWLLRKHECLWASNQGTDGLRSSPRDLVMRINALPKGTSAPLGNRTRVTVVRNPRSTDWAIAPPWMVLLIYN